MHPTNHPTLDGNGGIVHGLLGFCTVSVTDLAAIAVDTVADAVEEAALQAVDVHHGKIGEVFVDTEGWLVGRTAQVVHEIVARACGVI